MVYRIFYALCVFGVLMLAAISGLSVISITGRALTDFGLRPVPGDFEMVEAGTALAVFCFMPMCHLLRGHANVDLFYQSFSPAFQRLIDALCDGLMLVLWGVIAWRTTLAAMEFKANGELTFILQFPLWWPVSACALMAVLGCLAYVHKLLETLGVLQTPAAFRPMSAAEKH
jgi:TRAP-type C4-dicarboxylate transport system permease small subunit